jgi:hypothetical protein
MSASVTALIVRSGWDVHMSLVLYPIHARYSSSATTRSLAHRRLPVGGGPGGLMSRITQIDADVNATRPDDRSRPNTQSGLVVSPATQPDPLATPIDAMEPQPVRASPTTSHHTSRLSKRTTPKMIARVVTSASAAVRPFDVDVRSCCECSLRDRGPIWHCVTGDCTLVCVMITGAAQAPFWGRLPARSWAGSWFTLLGSGLSGLLALAGAVDGLVTGHLRGGRVVAAGLLLYGAALVTLGVLSVPAQAGDHVARVGRGGAVHAVGLD